MFFLAICVFSPLFITITLIGSGMNSSEGWQFQNSLLLECRRCFSRVDTYAFLCVTSGAQHRIFHHSLPGIRQGLQEQPVEDSVCVADSWVEVTMLTLCPHNTEARKEISWRYCLCIYCPNISSLNSAYNQEKRIMSGLHTHITRNSVVRCS